MISIFVLGVCFKCFVSYFMPLFLSFDLDVIDMFIENPKVLIEKLLEKYESFAVWLDIWLDINI